MAAGPQLGLVRRWWWIVLVGAALGAGAAIIAVRSMPPLYRATATLFVIPAEASLSQSFARTYAQMAVHPIVLERVREMLALPIPTSRLEGILSARPVPDTQLVEIVAQGSDPAVARDIANATAQAFIDQEAALVPAGPAGPSLRLGQPAMIPDQPVGPRPLPALMLGVLVGLLVGLGVAGLMGVPRAMPARLDATPSPPPTDVAETSRPPVPPIREPIGALDILRGVFVVAVAGAALLVPLAASGNLGVVSGRLSPPLARPANAPEVAVAPAPPAAPTAASAGPAAPSPAVPGFPLGASTALPPPDRPSAAQPEAEIAGATSAAALQPASAPAPASAELPAAPGPAVPPAPAEASPVAPAAPPIAQPTTAPIPERPAEPTASTPARVLFEDRFAGGPQLWPNDPRGTAWYDGDSYRLFAREPGQFVAVAAPYSQPLRDAVVAATFQKVAGPSGGVYGVYLRDSGSPARDGTSQSGNFYVLGVDDRGQYGVWRRDGTRWVDLVPLTPSDAVRRGTQANDIVAEAIDDRLSLRVNGVEVATVLGTQPQPGAVGVYVGGDFNDVVLSRFELLPGTAADANVAPTTGALGEGGREAEVAGATEARQPETRPGRTQAPQGFTAAFLREAPATSARAIASLPNGTAVAILPETASGDGFTWVRVRTADGDLGWIVSTAVAS
jgi:capsular polysaccharide biosynthesis protein